MFKWLRRNERGSIMVVVALSLAVLLGFTGFAVDYGTLALSKQELQEEKQNRFRNRSKNRSALYGKLR